MTVTRPDADVVGRALDRTTGSRAIPGNRVDLLIDGPEIFTAALAGIERARRWIHFDNYIIRDDRTGRRFAEALMERAAAGVRVRVLTDWFGSSGTPREYWERLRREGVEVRWFGPPRLFDLAANVVRNHRKLIVADGAWAVTGGYCVADEWAGDPEKGRQPWRETALGIQGPAAAALDAAFGQAWSAAGGALPRDELAEQAPEAGTSLVRVVAGVPGRERVFRTMALLLSGSTRRFWVTDAYFMAPRRLHQALLDASRDGVDIRLLVPGTSDLPWVRNLTRFGYRALLRGGVRIFEWNGPMLHAKTMVVDGRWVRVGSSNLNASSLFGNWELDVLVDDPALASAMEARFRRDIDQSAEVTLRPLLPRTGLGRPTALKIRRTSPPPGQAHRAGLRERGRRSLLILWTLLGAARRATFGPVALLALILGALFLLLPRTMAVIFAIASLWVAVAAAFHAFRRTDHG